MPSLPGTLSTLRPLSLFGALSLFALPSLRSGPGALAAQTVEGVVVTAESGAPLPDVRVTLLTGDGVPVGTAATAGDGTFHLRAPGPGTFLLHIEREGYLGTSRWLPALDAGERSEQRVELPVISGAAARVMAEAISREGAFQLPLEELCGEALRPWEAGILVGVARDRRTMEPVPGALVSLDLPAPGGGSGRPAGAGPPEPARGPAALTTASGAYWFCNVPVGDVRVTVRAEGFRPDAYTATVRAGSIAWYDALLRRGP